MDFDALTTTVIYLIVTLKVVARLLATPKFDIPFYFSSNELHLLLKSLAILSTILENLNAIKETSKKFMPAYLSIGQIRDYI